MKEFFKENIAYVVLASIAVALFVVQWLFGDVPVAFFAAPMNLLFAVLWLVVVVEGFRHRSKSAIVRFLLSAEATYLAIAVAATIAVAMGLQREPTTASWVVVGGALYVLTTLSLVILRGWRNEGGVRWRFLIMHVGLWLALVSMFFGAPDKQILRMQVDCTPSRAAVDERGVNHFLDYELRLEKFDVERAENGSPQQFSATVAVDDKVVTIAVNSPYSHKFGEDIYLVNYTAEGCVMQIVREPWKVVTVVGVAMLLIGAMMLCLRGYNKR